MVHPALWPLVAYGGPTFPAFCDALEENTAYLSCKPAIRPTPPPPAHPPRLTSRPPSPLPTPPQPPPPPPHPPPQTGTAPTPHRLQVVINQDGGFPSVRRGVNLVRLTDPLAFGEAGRKYALATAGGLPPIDLADTSDESTESADSVQSDSEGGSDSSGGTPDQPQEVQAAQGRLEQRREREAAKRARRRQTRGKKPSDIRSRAHRRTAEKARYKQQPQHQTRKREQKARARQRQREAMAAQDPANLAA